jgi:hypothetical protein
MTNNNHKAGEQINVEIPSHVMLEVRRPNGDLEMVRLPEPFKQLTAQQFAKIQKDTKAAGRGDVIGYTNVKKPADFTFSAADAATQSTTNIERQMRVGE